ncbi:MULTISPECIES: SH3 domain-containing protein [Cyclobacteriaceae]|nr:MULTISPECIES: SH3 domain-containing protein [Cyclobacteriaceae]
MYVSSTVGANLRNGPGTDYNVISTVGYNNQVKVVGNEGSWKRVEYNGNTGYISSSLLSEKQGRSSQNNSSYSNRGS